jgi:hypothetical protein
MNGHKQSTIIARLLGVALLVFGLLSHATTSEARLDPFYIVHGQSYGKLTPRVLFVVDTSGSMAWKQPWPDAACAWTDCESNNANQSRITAARRVMNTVVADAGDSASFAMMTFGMVKPPASSAELPDPCYFWGNGLWYRFTWITHTNQPNTGFWSPLTNIFGSQGTWLLCGDNRPFPYLRHDDLGGFSLANNQNFALSDEPLYKTHGSAATFLSSANFSRKVQFFPRFIGRRANLNCADPRQQQIVHNSWGDYGNTVTAKNTGICGRDFYYWPYVDGYPGYSYHVGYSPYDMWHRECDDGNYCWGTSSVQHRIGVNRRDPSAGATLYVPFYSEAVLAAPDVPVNAKGPLSPDDASVMFNGLTSATHLGGLDVTGGTPWRTAVGDVDSFVSFNAQGQPVANANTFKSNAEFSHGSVASYLAFLTSVADADICRPTMAILLTDGQPDPWASEGGPILFERLAKLRKKLGVKTYMVGFSEGGWSNATAWTRMHQIACAAAGANGSTSPCTEGNNYNWDTCANPNDPVNGCAWLASNDEQLADALSSIIDDIIETSVPAGPPMVANEFQLSDLDDPNSNKVAVQTSLQAWTETPSWRGHLTRGACTDEDPNNPGQLAEYCANVASAPIDSDETETFGPCPLGRVWDAGECLAQTPWTARRLYTHGFGNELIKIADNGTTTAAFRSLVLTLNGQGKINPPLTPGQETAEIDKMVMRLLGQDAPGGWKLPGLANSAPVLIRRVPQPNKQFAPSVGIRDPHCAGRRNVMGDNAPSTLESFASQAWELSDGGGFADYYEYTEAVLVGDDFGLLHAFHYNSGNELFGFLPMALINNARILSVNGTANYGQPEDLSKHVFGIASTVNAGLAFDDKTKKWKHLAVFGLGPGGAEILTLDVSHMGRLQGNAPVEVLWTSSTSEIAAEYLDSLGETWSRPALTYGVVNDEMSVEPKAYMVFGSGYREGLGSGRRGRVVWVVDAITGQTVTDKAIVQNPAVGTTYDTLADLAQVSDVAVASHCLSRYWGEMQEAYWVDPAGRLFRWDLATGIGDVTSFPHVADSGGKWTKNAAGFSVAKEAFRFPACQGTGEFNCGISAIGSGSKGDVFTFSPAVAANNRIDSIDNSGDKLAEGDRDQFLIAMVSGSPNDTSIDAGAPNSDFHSSIYLLTDDHRVDKAGGLSIPGVGAATTPGSHPFFMRLPLSQIQRTRHVVYANGTVADETRVFSKRARPIRAPMIRVTGVADGDQQVDAEVYYVTYTIFEPGDAKCDPRWFDKNTNEWVYDAGTTYEITFRLAVSGSDPFNFQNGYSLPGDPGDGFGNSGALSMPMVRQVESCPDGNCGATLNAPKTSPCDPNVGSPPVGGVVSVSTGYSEIDGFTPLEIAL